MIGTRTILSSAVVLSACLLVPGCMSKGGGDAGALGRAQAAVTNVPSDGTVACIAITSTGSWASTQSFDVTPGESTVFTLTGIPTGTVRFDGSAYPTACSLVTPSSVATWASLPVLATVTEGQTTMVSLELQQAGASTIGVGFMPSPSCRSEGQPCLTGGDCCSGSCGADDTCAPASPSSSSSTSSSSSSSSGGVCAPGATQCSGNGVETCDATGQWGAPADCASYACVSGACNTICKSDGDCASGNFCSGGACIGEGVAGAACAANDQCASGVCGTSGSGNCCTTACSSFGGACGATGCDAEGACVFAAKGTACGAGICDGAGNCI